MQTQLEDATEKCLVDPGTVVSSFLDAIVCGLARQVQATQAVLLLDDTHLGSWMARVDDPPDSAGLSQMGLDAVRGIIRDAAGHGKRTQKLSLEHGPDADVVFLVNTPNTVVALMYSAPVLDAVNTPANVESTVDRLQDTFNRSLIISGMGQSLLAHGSQRCLVQVDDDDSHISPDLVTLCTSFAAGLVKAESACIMLYDSGSCQMLMTEPGFGFGKGDSLGGGRPSAMASHSATVFKTLVPYLSNEHVHAGSPRSAGREPASFDIRQLAIVPLHGKDGPIGVLNVINKLDGVFSAEDVTILNGISRSIGCLVENHIAECSSALDLAGFHRELQIKSRELASLKLDASLTDALLSCLAFADSGITRMLFRLSEFLGKPTMVYSTSGQILGYSNFGQRRAPSALPSEVFESLAIGSHTSRMAVVTTSSGEPEIHHVLSASEDCGELTLSRHNVLLAPLSAGRKRLGFLAVCHFDQALEPEKQTGLRRACTIISAEMLRLFAERGPDGMYEAVLVRALILGDLGESPRHELLDYSSSLGISLTPPFCVLVGRTSEPDESLTAAAIREWRKLRAVMDEYSREPYLLSARSNELIAIITSLGVSPDGAQRESLPMSKLRDRLRKAILNSNLTSLSIGIGSIGPLASIPTSYNEGRVAALLAQTTLREAPRVMCADDLGVYRLLAQIQGEGVLHEYSQKTLDPLMRHDENGHQYLKTLEAFLDSECQLNQAARQLNMHSNSVRYRLNRIEELLGYSLKDSAARLNLALALKALRLVGMSADREPRPSAQWPEG